MQYIHVIQILANKNKKKVFLVHESKFNFHHSVPVNIWGGLKTVFQLKIQLITVDS